MRKKPLKTFIAGAAIAAAVAGGAYNATPAAADPSPQDTVTGVVQTVVDIVNGVLSAPGEPEHD